MSERSPFRLDADALARFDALRDEAIRQAVAASEQAYPEFYARPGQRAREACTEDTGHHLDFLRPTLESGDASPFVAYVAWLAQVLGSRNIPRESLGRSLVVLAAFFRSRLRGDAAPVIAALDEGRSALSAPVEAPVYDRLCPTPWEESTAYCDAALQGRRREADALLTAAVERGGSLPMAAIHVIQPALYEVGRRWQQNQVSVAQEHLASALSQTLMAQGLGRAEAAPDNGRRALFACSTGNHHTVGLRMVADAFELDGWTTYYLGANTPTAALIAQVRETAPHLVGLSASLPQHLRGLRETVAALRAALGDACPRVVIGGLVFNQFPLLAGSMGAGLLGADACAAAAATHEA